MVKDRRRTLRKASMVASFSLHMPWARLHSCSCSVATFFQYSILLCCDAIVASVRVPACDSTADLSMLH